MSSFHKYPIPGSVFWRRAVASVADLPNGSVVGEMRFIINIQAIYGWDGAAWSFIIAAGGVSGSGTDNRIVRWDGTATNNIQNSLVSIDDSGSINIPSGQNYNLNSVPYKNTIVLDDLSGVNTASASADDLLFFNGTNWINKPYLASGPGTGDIFYLDDTLLVTGPSDSTSIHSLVKVPITTAEVQDTITITNTTALMEAYLYDTALSGSFINGGEWQFDIWASISNTANSNYLLFNAAKVEVGTGTVTVTGSGTSRTATVSGSTPFVAGDANAAVDVSSYLQLAGGLFQITAFTSDSEVTIATPVGYVNDSGSAFSIHRKLFQTSTPDLSSSTIIQYDWNVVQPNFAINSTDKLSLFIFARTDAASPRTFTFIHNGTKRYSHFHTPLITRHNTLEAIQGGSSDERYHLTSAEHTIATQAATASLSGYLSSTDWNTFDGKQNPQSRVYHADAINGALASAGADGFSVPFKQLDELLAAVELDIQARIVGGETRSNCKYVINLAPAAYSQNITIPAASIIQFNMTGASITGNITRVVTQVGYGADYYSKVIFNGAESHRAEKGHQSGLLTGTLTISTFEGSNYLHYTTFKGIELTNNITVSNGVAVIMFDESSHYDATKTILGTGAILLEMINRSRIKATLSGNVALYNCFDSELNLISVTPTNDSKCYNMVFDGTISFTNATIYLDGTSHKSLYAASPTLTGCTINFLEGDVNLSNSSTVTGTTIKDALDTLNSAKENSANKGAANGYASLDASALVPITQIPPAALERLVIVADEVARFALTTATVQNGDTVKQTDTNIMYFVKDDTNLNNANGYETYSAGTASAIAWSGVTSTPTTLAGYGITDAEPTLTKGNLTEDTSSVLTIGSGTNAVIGSGTTIQVKQSSAGQSGYLSSTDWSTFNGKQAVYTIQAKNSGFTAADHYTYIIDCSGGAVAVQLPSPASGLSFKLKDALNSSNTYNITLVRAGAEKIDNASSTYTIDSDGFACEVVSDGTDWFIL